MSTAPTRSELCGQAVVAIRIDLAVSTVMDTLHGFAAWRDYALGGPRDRGHGAPDITSKLGCRLAGSLEILCQCHGATICITCKSASTATLQGMRWLDCAFDAKRAT